MLAYLFNRGCLLVFVNIVIAALVVLLSLSLIVCLIDGRCLFVIVVCRCCPCLFCLFVVAVVVVICLFVVVAVVAVKVTC